MALSSSRIHALRIRAAAERRSRPNSLGRAKPLLSVYVSGHGFGHFTRTATFLERLLQVVDCELDVCSVAAPDTWPPGVAERVRCWRALPCDVGVVQRTELEVDRSATERALRDWNSSYPRRLEEERRRLVSGSAAVLADVPPLAFDAAAEAGVPSFALANFSWDWIYARMGWTDAATTAEQAYRRAGLLLELTPAAPMTAFRARVGIGVLGRSMAAERSRTRALLGLVPQERLVLVAFRSPASYRLPPPTLDVRYVSCDGARADRPDRVHLPADVSFLHLLAAADVVVGKTGYGIVADTATSGTPFLYTTRTGFPEDDVLAAWLQSRDWARPVSRQRLRAGTWLADLESMPCQQPHEPVRFDADAARAGLEALRDVLGK